MKKYDSYKNSGIEWIGEIPSHWDVKTLKRLAKICNGQDHKNVWDDNGIYPIIGTGGEFGKANKYLHQGPSVILGRKGTIDKPQYIEMPFWSVDTAYYTEIKPEINPRLFFYLCKTINFDLYKYGSAVPSMTQEVLSQIPFSLPTLFEEQTAIAKYLDRKTAEIDELIADKKRLVELYEEEKTAIINQAVTKGISPNTPMKDSGIEWIGEIPSHWDSTRLKFLGKSIIGIIYSPDDVVNEGEGILVLRSSNVQDGKLAFEDCVYVNKEVQEKHLTKKGDILLCARNGSAHLVGKAAYIEKKNEGLTFGAFMSIVRSKLDKYLFYFFNSQIFKAQTGLFSTSTINQLTSDTLNNLFISFPREEQEQTAIANYLESECARIDSKKSRTEQLIDLLTEYRTALISEVVTGKIKVSE